MMDLHTFAEEVARRFEFLETDYECSPPEDRTNVYMRSLTYRNAACEVKISYELGSRPWVVLSRLARRGDHIVPVDGVNLMVIVEEAGNPLAVVDPSVPDLPDQILKADIQFQADALHNLAHSFLRGDFTQWPQLVQKQHEVHQKRRRAFGENADGGVSS